MTSATAIRTEVLRRRLQRRDEAELAGNSKLWRVLGLLALVGGPWDLAVRAEDDDGARLAGLSEPLVAESVNQGPETRFVRVYVVTRPLFAPARFAADLPRAAAAVCGWVELEAAKPAKPTEHRFYAVFGGGKGRIDDSQVTIAVENNDPRDLSQDAMERSARFIRGWRQYCLDAAHSG
jgi:hypothetical protein